MNAVVPQAGFRPQPPEQAFDVLGDPVRRRLLELLAGGERTSGEMTVVVQAEFGISQSAVSQHLKVLRDGGFATVRADGAKRFYSVAAGPLSAVDAWLQPFRAFWTPRPTPAPVVIEAAREKKKRPPPEAIPVCDGQLEMF